MTVPRVGQEGRAHALPNKARAATPERGEGGRGVTEAAESYGGPQAQPPRQGMGLTPTRGLSGCPYISVLHYYL